MRKGTKISSSRRPLEYLLGTVLIILVVVAFWIQIAIRKDSAGDTSDTSQSATQPQGTTQEIDQLTQDELTEEALTDSSYDQHEQSTAQTDAAADDIGGIYDESAY